MTRRILLVAAVALAHAGPVRSDDSKPVAVPFEMLQKGRQISGHLTVQVKVNGKGPYRLIFDTGAPVILLSGKVGREAGLLGKSAKPAPGMGLMMPGQVRVDKLEIGSLAAKDVNAIVLDHPTVKAIAEVFGPVDGIVGFPFFARFRTSIDYQARRLTFTPNGYEPADVLQTLMKTLTDRPPGGKDPPPRVLAPAGLWGLRVEKPDDDAGVRVSDVFADSPAATAGVKAGDRLLTVDGRWTDSVADCYDAAADAKPGRPTEIVLRRDGQEVKLTVTPAAGL